MHAEHYAKSAGFGQAFEAIVASGMAEFSQRLDRPVNGLWLALNGADIVGSIAIDGEDLGGGVAHLRWFLVEEAFHGQGLGRRLIEDALAFCAARNFAAVRLWTFRGLDAARRLYERQGFALVEERAGSQWGSAASEQCFERRTRAA